MGLRPRCTEMAGRQPGGGASTMPSVGTLAHVRQSATRRKRLRTLGSRPGARIRRRAGTPGRLHTLARPTITAPRCARRFRRLDTGRAAKVVGPSRRKSIMVLYPRLRPPRYSAAAARVGRSRLRGFNQQARPAPPEHHPKRKRSHAASSGALAREPCRQVLTPAPGQAITPCAQKGIRPRLQPQAAPHRCAAPAAPGRAHICQTLRTPPETASFP